MISIWFVTYKRGHLCVLILKRHILMCPGCLTRIATVYLEMIKHACGQVSTYAYVCTRVVHVCVYGLITHTYVYGDRDR